jgi:hypothetical protein
VRDAASRAATKTGMKPGLRDAVAKLCDASCNSRKKGASWSEVESALREGCNGS